MSDTRMEHGHGHHKSWSEWSTGAKVAVVLGAIIIVPCLFALCGFVTMWLWNALMPAIFNLPAIRFWQAVGLLLLSQLFFKGAGAGRAGRGHWKKRQVWKHMKEEQAPGTGA